MSQVKYVSEYGKDTNKLGHKDREDFQKTIKDRIRKNSKPGTSEEKIQEKATQLENQIDQTSKILFKK